MADCIHFCGAPFQVLQVLPVNRIYVFHIPSKKLRIPSKFNKGTAVTTSA